jgi:diguanylate cyclase (GGDEF)-like protein/PAS domain S-box-containing protein
MPQVLSLIEQNMDLVFFVYGLSFMVMALVIVVQPREESRYELAKLTWLLVAFGFSHGMLEWLDLWIIVRGHHSALGIWKAALLFISFGFLFEFGRRLLLVTPVAPLIRRVLGMPVYGLILLGFLLLLMTVPDWLLASKIASRYFLGFTGATMAGVGFLHYFSANIASQPEAAELSWAKKYFIMAAIAFLSYGVLGGLVVPAADIFPASVVNYQWFHATFHIPVQLLRATSAVIVAISLGAILQIFHQEGRERLRRSLAVTAERGRELEESEASLREITTTMGEGLYVMDLQGRILFSNPEAQCLLGWSEAELLNQDGHQLFHHKRANNENYPVAACEIRKVVDSGQIYRSEQEVFWCKDGTQLNVEVCSSPVFRGGKIVSSVTTFSDITQRKQAEVALQAAKEYAENLINTANTMFLELDIDGNVKRYNPAAEEVTGYTLAEIIGRNWFEIVVPRERYPEVWEMFERLSSGGLLKHFENPILTKSGEERHIIWQNNEVRENGQVVGVVTFGIDITERRRVEEAMSQQKEFLNAILENEPECVKVIAANGELLQMNRAGLEMLEVETIEEARKQGLTSFILPAYRDAFKALSQRVFSGETDVLEFLIEGKRGTQRWLETHASPLQGAQDGVVALVAVTRDITERKQAEKALYESEEKFRLISTSAKDAILIISTTEEIAYWNPAAEHIFGYTAEQAMGKNLHELLAPPTYREDGHRGFDHFRVSGEGTFIGKTFEVSALRQSGEEFPIELSISAVQMQGEWHALGIIRDITERKQAEQQIQQLAYYDTLTNLPNRRLLLDRLNLAFSHARRHQRAMAVMFLDLDSFKQINDSLGHDVGDELLKVVASRLEQCVRSGDTVSRQGGDEFVIVLPEISQPQDAAIVAEKIIAALGQPIDINSMLLPRVTTSIGIALFSGDSSDDVVGLMKKADMAMYSVKDTGRNGYCFFHDIQAAGN